MTEYIYGLFHETPAEHICFYIGHTKNLRRREYEHRNLARHPEKKEGQYLRYDYIRNLEKQNICWELVELAEIPAGVWVGDYEREHVIRWQKSGKI